MTAPGAKVGPLTAADLQNIWLGANDSGFTQSLAAAGEGNGFEAYTQMFAQAARASLAVDVTTQAAYILPHSSQSNPPASRAHQATVGLTFSRSSSSPYINWPLVILPGNVFVAEQTTDYGPGGGVVVQSGRRYLVTQALVMPPGDAGPYTVQATAELPGYGYNNPLAQYKTAAGQVVPGTINAIAQPGTGYFNNQASLYLTPAIAPAQYSAPVLPPSAVATLVANNVPDMFVPGMVGQYLLMTAGANVGKVGRVASYLAPGAVAPGSAVTLAFDQCAEVTSVVGTFQQGETLIFHFGGSDSGTGAFLGLAPSGVAGRSRMVYVLQTGQFVATATVRGASSGATATAASFPSANLWAANGVVPPTGLQASAESWRVLDWAADLQVTVTNLAQPSGGTSGMLDELGYERGVPATTNENDDAYRRRVAVPADTVSPNAILRASARAMAGALSCYRDTQNNLQGFFYDGGPIANGTNAPPAGGSFYDTDCLLFSSPTFQFGTAFTVGQPIFWLDVNGLIVAKGYWGGYNGFFVRAATAAPLPANTFAQVNGGADTITITAAGALVVDGLTTLLGDVVLVNQEASATRNGIYFVSTQGGVGSAVLTRLAPFTTSGGMASGMYVATGSSGATNGNATFQLTTPPPINLDSTNLTFAKISTPAQMILALRGGPQNHPPVRTTWASGDVLTNVAFGGTISGTAQVPNPTSFSVAAVVAPSCFYGKRFEVYLDYASFRSYFMMGVPAGGAGDPGFLYGPHPAAGLGGFYDQAGMATCFYDGKPFLEAKSRAGLWSALNPARAGGVGFDLYVESVGCP